MVESASGFIVAGSSSEELLALLGSYESALRLRSQLAKAVGKGAGRAEFAVPSCPVAAQLSLILADEVWFALVGADRSREHERKAE